MRAFGASSWDEVEQHFREGGDLEGLWGWLEVLRRAENGYWAIGVDTGAGVSATRPQCANTCIGANLSWSVMERGAGVFSINDDGRILVGLGDHSEFAQAFGHFTLANRSRDMFFATGSSSEYYHINLQYVDWGDMGLDATGIVLSPLDATPLAGLSQAAGQAVDALAIHKGLQEWRARGKPGPVQDPLLWIGLAVDAGGAIPLLGAIPDALSILLNVGSSITH